MAKLLTGTRIYGTGTVDTQLFVSGTNPATSITSGALQVIGGVGIGGALWVGTTSFVAGSQIITTATINDYASRTYVYAGTDTAVNTSTGNITIWNTSTLQSVTNRGATTNNAISFTNSTSATSTASGALQVVGGVGVGGSLYVGNGISGSLIGGATGSLVYQSNTSTTAFLSVGSSGQVLTVSGGLPAWAPLSGVTAGNATTASNIALGTAGQVPYQTAPGVTSFYGPGTAGNVLVSNGTSAPSYNNTLTLAGTTAATSTNTGVLQVFGGVGIGGDIVLGGKLFVGAGATAYSSGKFVVDTPYAGAAVFGNIGNTAASTGIFLRTSSVAEIQAIASSTIRLKDNTGVVYLDASASAVSIPTTTASTSTNTGALQVAGGVGIGGGIYVGNNSTFTGIVLHNNSTPATSTATGALQVWGGVGIGQNLYVGGTIYGNLIGYASTSTSTNNLIGGATGSLPYQSNISTTAFLAIGSSGQILTVTGGLPAWTSLGALSAGNATTASNIANGTAGQVPYQTAPGVTSFYGPGTAGNVLVSNGTSAPSYNNTLTLTSTVASSSTASGALKVVGGVGVGGYVYAGGMKIISPNTDANVVGTIPFDIQGAWMRIGDFNSSFDPTNGIGIKFHDSGNVHYSIGSSGTNFVISQTSTNGEQLFPSGRTDILTLSNTGIVTVNATTAAAATNTGALLVLGGVGIGRDLFVGGNTYQVGGTYGTLATTFNLINTTATTVNFAGAATTLNVGATSGSTNVRNNLTVSGNLTVQGTTTIVDSTVTNIADPIITLGGGANNAAPTVDDNKDRGVAFKWMNNGGSTSTGFFGYKDSTGYFTYIATATITNEVVTGTKGAMDVNLAGGSAMAIHYQSAADTTAFLAAGTSGYILQTNGTGSAPSWVSASGVSAGSATYADNVRTIAQTASATYYPTFVDSNNATNAYELVYTTSSFNINPATGAIGIVGTSTVTKLQIGQGYAGITYASTSNIKIIGNPNNNTDEIFINLVRDRNPGVQFAGAASITLGSYIVPTSASAPSSRLTFLLKNTADNTDVANVSVMSLLDTGNVGIGTTLPTARLQLGGQSGSVATPLALQFSNDYSSGSTALSSKIFLYNTGGTEVYGFAIGPASDIQYHAGGVSNTAGKHIWYVGNNEKLRITTNGALAFSGASNYGTSGQVLQSNGDAAPTWVTIATSNASSTGTTSTFVIQNSTSATSTNTGALQVWGGAGVGGSLYVGGAIYSGGSPIVPI
jgi:hypothetical protein